MNLTFGKFAKNPATQRQKKCLSNVVDSLHRSRRDKWTASMSTRPENGEFLSDGGKKRNQRTRTRLPLSCQSPQNMGNLQRLAAISAQLLLLIIFRHAILHPVCLSVCLSDCLSVCQTDMRGEVGACTGRISHAKSALSVRSRRKPSSHARGCNCAQMRQQRRNNNNNKVTW